MQCELVKYLAAVLQVIYVCAILNLIFFRQYDTKYPKPREENKPLGLQHFLSSFFILVGGIFVATVKAIHEIRTKSQIHNT